ncbi:MAG: M67 family metallopeptidase [Chloroflexota bacterium]|nr:M67 family metallopeptidase [Chloroflexota bacterium]
MLTISRATLAAMQAQGQASYPDECCGLLVGRFEADRRIAVEAVPVANEWTANVQLTADESTHSLRDRFYISAQAYLQVQRAALRRELDIVGCYHTHPDDRAWPSERDRVGAAGVGGGPYFSFVVLSIMEGTAADVASALLSADGQTWLPEELTIEEL